MEMPFDVVVDAYRRGETVTLEVGEHEAPTSCDWRNGHRRSCRPARLRRRTSAAKAIGGAVEKANRAREHQRRIVGATNADALIGGAGCRYEQTTA